MPANMPKVYKRFSDSNTQELIDELAALVAHGVDKSPENYQRYSNIVYELEKNRCFQGLSFPSGQ